MGHRTNHLCAIISPKETPPIADTLTATPPAEDAAYFQQAIAQCLAEIDQLRAQMAQDQIGIDRDQAAAWSTLAEIKATLGKLQKKAA